MHCMQGLGSEQACLERRMGTKPAAQQSGRVHLCISRESIGPELGGPPETSSTRNQAQLHCVVLHMGHVTWQKIALKPTACKRHSCAGSTRHAICMHVLAHYHCSSCNYMTCMLLQREVHKGQQPVKAKLPSARKQVRCRAASMHLAVANCSMQVLPTFLQELRALIVTLARSFIGMASYAGEHWRPVACVCSLLVVVNACRRSICQARPPGPRLCL